ncbi:serine/threonine-protein kinase [Fimbriiglobus ruber]|uniref:Serine/threonine protein kinase PrkC, regulator of stationary phase n=1 Tax=Fimbriiglobus ruber TaxID=1908690 RepID=A0A225DSQ6_9BACT|nr:serine/threonine-protein kinase [Fimbriiglobus ruber]OWK39117.1 Serine/threonine protein kinase PrkC, regulator of stationary phase [Fimbriiglobus ruber]
MAPHPSRIHLLAFTRGELAEADVAAVESHLEECESCCFNLAEVDSGDAFSSRLRAAVRHSPDDTIAPTRLVSSSPATTTAGLPVIPGYEVVRELGRGGIGVVYEARDCVLHRTVAVKLLRGGTMATPEELTRFRSEALAIARLHHPNVVQVFDTGTLDGNPYIVLEYVAGGSLSQHTKGNPQPPRAAADLVAAIAKGVQAAHDAGIVHRDLKPANVLVSPPPAGPKISDFGLAKMLDGSPSSTTTGAISGTPNYMAPEQAAGKPAGPTADVYAIGAILYELLAGHPPFVGVTVGETLELVRHQEPVALTRLQRNVPRDLDTICLKCLQKEPASRYPSAAALGDDLRLFLDGRPIKARPLGAFGRSVKWCRRNPRVAVLLGLVTALICLLGAGGVVAALVFAEQAEYQKSLKDKADEARRQAEIEQGHAREAADRATAEADRATQITNFLKGLFEPKDQLFVANVSLDFRGQGDKQNASALLKIGLEKLNGPDGFHDRPLVRADLLYQIGTIYVGLGKPGDARPLLEEALRLRRLHLPPSHPDLGKAVLAAAEMRSVYEDEVDGGLFREAIAIYKANAGPDGLELAAAEVSFAFLTCYLNGGSSESQKMLEHAYEVRRRLLGESDFRTQTTLLTIITVHIQESRHLEAAPLLMRLMTASEQRGVKPELLACLRQMVETYSAKSLLGNAAAVEPARRLVKQMSNVFGGDHYLTVQAKSNLAWFLFDTGNFEETITLDRECLSSLETWGLPNRFLRACFTLRLSRAMARSNKPIGQIEAETRKAVSLFRELAAKNSGGRTEHPHALQFLARILAQNDPKRNREEIGKLLEEALTYSRAHSQISAYRRAFALSDAGHWRLLQGDFKTSADLFAEAAELWRHEPKNTNHFLAETLALRSFALLKQGRADEAGAARREVEAFLKQNPSDDHINTSNARELLVGRVPPWGF